MHILRFIKLCTTFWLSSVVTAISFFHIQCYSLILCDTKFWILRQCLSTRTNNSIHFNRTFTRALKSLSFSFTGRFARTLLFVLVWQSTSGHVNNSKYISVVKHFLCSALFWRIVLFYSKTFITASEFERFK